MTYPDESSQPQQPHSNPYDKAYPASPFESEPQQPSPTAHQPQPQQSQQAPYQGQQNYQQNPWPGAAAPQGASQSGAGVPGAQPPSYGPAGPHTSQYPQQPPQMPPGNVPYNVAPYAPVPPATAAGEKNILALIALIMGLLCLPSLIIAGWWPISLSIATLVVSIVAVVRRKNYAEQNRRTGFAITGLVLSSVTLAIIVVIILFVLIVEGVNSGYSDYDNYRSYLPNNNLDA